MELDDCAFPLLAGIEITDDPKAAFDGATSPCWSAPARAARGWSAPTCSRRTAASSSPRARRSTTGAADDVKVLVVGNPANTNALIAMSNAPDVPTERFTAMIRLDHNRAIAQLAKKLGAAVSDDQEHDHLGEPLGRPSTRTWSTRGERQPAPGSRSTTSAWIADEFIPTVAKRGAAIIEARGASSAASAANAAIDHVHDWVSAPRTGTGSRWPSPPTAPTGSRRV